MKLTASCNAAVTPSSTVWASIAAAFLPVRLPPVVPTILRGFIGSSNLLVTVLTAVEALYPVGVALCMHGNPMAHN